MKYRTDKYGNKVSVLGYGCMRFTNKGVKLDYNKAEKEIVLTEKALSKVIMGEVKEKGIKTYQKNLEVKGFKCNK